MAITDLQISDELMTDAPSIKYRGDEGPKSPQQMADALLREEYEKYVYDLLEQRPDATPMSFEEFRRMVIGDTSRGPVLPSDEDPINPFGPKPMGPLPDDPTKPVNPFRPKREMAAYGGIMGLDGRKQYGVGSFFQKYIKDPIEMALTGKTYEDLERESQERVDREPKNYEGLFDRLFKGEKKKDKEGREYREGGVQEYIIPAIGGLTAGLFAKKNQDGSPGGQPTADETALMLADLKKSANILDQKQGLAAGLNFLPDVAARKFTPEEMIAAYKTTAANGGRIGMAEGGIMDLGGLEKDYRNTGGFVDIGAKEKADDVPARLSVNEFVFTADAVRNAGGGDIDEGAKVMERVMKHLEDGGQLSRESQGMGGAREMFEVSERLSEVV